MIDNFDGNPPRCRLLKRPRGVAVERLPRLVVNLRFQRRLEGFVRVIRAEEISVTHKKTLRVVIGINKPAGDAIRAVAPNLPRVGMKYVNTMYYDL